MSLKYKRVDELLNSIGADVPEFTVCSESGAESFKLMRAQLAGELFYSSARGAYAEEPLHLDKCIQIIKEAQREFVDLLLFPEYAVPYEVISRICKNSKLWPAKNKLWVLPCCGANKDVFLKKLKQFAKMDHINVIGYNLENPIYNDVDYKHFVNAIMYVFIADVDSDRQLFILPQLKTYSMRDVDFACEEIGLSLGNTIFVFGKNNGTILLSLICADVMNDTIDWRRIQNMGTNCIILNPQLNSNPRNPSFSRLRQTIFDRSIETIIITCNWAAPTRVRGVMEADKDIYIELSWSCIYYKKDRNLESHKWAEDSRERIWQIERKNLYAGFMKNSRTEVWYTDNDEIIHILNITKIRTIGFSIRRPQGSGGNVLKYIFSDKGLQQIRDERSFDFLEEIRGSAPVFFEAFHELANEQYGAYAFPFMETDRERIDRFFDLIGGKIDWEYLLISDSEEVHRYTLALTKDERSVREIAFSGYLYMVEALKEKMLPEYLKRKFESAHILYWNERNMYSDLYEREENHIKDRGESIYTSYVDNEGEAQKLLSHIEHRKEKIHQETLDICIMTRSRISRQELVIYPKYNKDITRGKSAFTSTDIAGGDIDE